MLSFSCIFAVYFSSQFQIILTYFNINLCILQGKMKLLIILFFFICNVAVCYGDTGSDSLFHQLNTVLANKEIYVKQKEDRIRSLQFRLAHQDNLNARFIVIQALYNEYKSFKYDSAYLYSKKMLSVANQLHDPAKTVASKMSISFTLLSAGMFWETLEILNQIDVRFLTVSDYPEYYFLKARCYLDWGDFDHNIDYSDIYYPKGLACIDSALARSPQGSYYYWALKGLKNMRTANYAASESNYLSLLKLPRLSANQFAVTASSLSYVYLMQGAQNKSTNLLIKAAIADIRSATKETVAIYGLAKMLYEKGEQNNAFNYINEAMDEAIFYGARQRQVTISSILPIIEAQRIASVEQQRRSLFIYSSVITLLVIFVIGFTIIIFIQLKKIRIADKIINEANVSLQESNKNLEETNKQLSIANRIKNEYISYYFNINSVYIDKLENFKKSLDKKLVSKRYDDALVAVNNLNLENERRELFHTFDKVFLKLFPDFITRFNSLFEAEDRMVIPKDELLNTELRIFALIRMGIHDNDRISKILGYSINTIYAYKNRVKTKSIVSNEEFEEHIMEIGAV